MESWERDTGDEWRADSRDCAGSQCSCGFQPYAQQKKKCERKAARGKFCCAYGKQVRARRERWQQKKRARNAKIKTVHCDHFQLKTKKSTEVVNYVLVFARIS